VSNTTAWQYFTFTNRFRYMRCSKVQVRQTHDSQCAPPLRLFGATFAITGGMPTARAMFNFVGN
jgi:hypothetical protein